MNTLKQQKNFLHWLTGANHLQIASQAQVINTSDKQDTIIDKIIATVYPNPSANDFKLYLYTENNQKVEIELYNVDGRKLYTKTVNGSGVFTIGTSTYKKGIYLLTVKQGTFSKTLKLVKQ